MSQSNSAKRTRRPAAFRNLKIFLSLLAVIILAACNSATANNSVNRALRAKNAPPQKTLNAAGDVIDISASTRGLSGDLKTARAGQGLLADNGLARPLDGGAAPPAFGDYAEPAPSAPTPIQVKANSTAALLTAAYEQTGRPYKSGGQNPAAGFDAAGFTRWVYGQRGLSIPRDAKRQAAFGRQIAKEDVRPGDLLVYRDPSAKDLHAAAKSGVVTETDAFGPQFSPYFVGARRYFDDPKAAPLSDEQKMTAASSAVKTALSELGPEDQPQRQAYSKPKRTVKAKARRSVKKRRR